MKNITIVLVSIVLLGLAIGAYFMMQGTTGDIAENKTPTPIPTTVPTGTNKPSEQKPIDKTLTILGKSIEGRDIIAYHYGDGSDEILFIGGIHGGYEWNTVLLAREAMEYFKTNLDSIPKNIKVTIIPVLNPDGLFKVVGTIGNFTAADVSKSQDIVVSGRFNANKVDLGRNFDCQWQKEGAWQNKTVSGGSMVFSEPESQIIKKYVEQNKLIANVTWYSSAGGVYASSCNGNAFPESKIITKKYALAAGYPSYNSFDYYPLSGDIVNWFEKMNIPAISVLLTDHTNTEWNKNKAGIESILKHFAK